MTLWAIYQSLLGFLLSRTIKSKSNQDKRESGSPMFFAADCNQS